MTDSNMDSMSHATQQTHLSLPLDNSKSPDNDKSTSTNNDTNKDQKEKQGCESPTGDIQNEFISLRENILYAEYYEF